MLWSSFFCDNYIWYITGILPFYSFADHTAMTTDECKWPFLVHVYIILLFRMTGHITVALNLAFKMNQSSVIVQVQNAIRNHYVRKLLNCNGVSVHLYATFKWPSQLVMSGVNGILSMATLCNTRRLFRTCQPTLLSLHHTYGLLSVPYVKVHYHTGQDRFIWPNRDLE